MDQSVAPAACKLPAQAVASITVRDDLWEPGHEGALLL